MMRNVEKCKKLAQMSCTKPDTVKKCTYQLANVPLSRLEECDGVWVDLKGIELPDASRKYNLNDVELTMLRRMYLTLYQGQSIVESEMLRTGVCHTNIHLGNELYASTKYGRSNRYGGAMASWCGENGAIDCDATVRPCKIISFMVHNLSIKDEAGNESVKKHVVAKVRWYLPYPEVSKYKSPISVWEEKKFVQPGPSMFIPVQRLYSKFGFAVHNGGRLVIAPLPPHLFV